MGALFTIAFFLILLGVGLITLIISIVGLAIGKKRRKAQKPFSAIVTVVFTVILFLGVALTTLPIGFFSFIAIVNSIPPEGFVETKIVIEENGYQDTQFTADGVVYEALDFALWNDENTLTPIFTYKTSGFLNGSRCGNYYSVKNNQGFHLVSGEHGSLFAPAEEKERVIAYYTSTENLCAYYDDWDEREFKLSEEETKIVCDFLKLDMSLLKQERVTLAEEEEFSIRLVCKEELVFVNSYWFLSLNGTIYYVHGSDYANDDRIEYILIELPSELADTMMDIHKRP